MTTGRAGLVPTETDARSGFHLYCLLAPMSFGNSLFCTLAWAVSLQLSNMLFLAIVTKMTSKMFSVVLMRQQAESFGR